MCGSAEHLRRNFPALPVHLGTWGGGGGEFELTGPTEASHVVGEHSTYGDSMIENAVRNCPEVKVKLGGVDVYV